MAIDLAALSPAQREVWQAEQDYWVLTRDRDVAGFLALAHERVTVWPVTAKLPIDRARLGETQRARGARDPITDYDLAFHAILVHGDAAIVYYTVVTTGPAAKSQSLITHTWIKDRGAWRLAGGMSRRE
jgi:ketosteroid isomerase-like protein